METEAPAAARSRPRPILLIALGVAVVALLLVKLMPSGSARPGTPASNQARVAPPGTPNDRVNPQDLDVHLDALKSERPQPGGADRNPFRFQPKAPPPPPPGPPGPPAKSIGGDEKMPPPLPPPEVCHDGIDNNQNGQVDENCGPPPPPPITLKFIGIIEGQGKKLAALSDCRFTYRGEEGQIVDGRYRVVRIGVESVMVEYVDGRGRTTIRLSGQDCVGR